MQASVTHGPLRRHWDDLTNEHLAEHYAQSDQPGYR